MKYGDLRHNVARFNIYSSLVKLQMDFPVATFEVGITLCAAPYDFFPSIFFLFSLLCVINFGFGTFGSLLPNDRFGLYMKYPLYALSNLKSFAMMRLTAEGITQFNVLLSLHVFLRHVPLSCLIYLLHICKFHI